MSEEVPYQQQDQGLQDLLNKTQPAPTSADVPAPAPASVSESAGTHIPGFASNPEEADQLQKRMEEMEKEAARLRDFNNSANGESENDREKKDIDSRSVYIGNVDYGATPLELQQHFSSAGIVNRVTILMNKFTGQPKGFAYLEFTDIDGVNKAVATLDGTVFRDRELKVSAKRTNIPGISTTNRGGRGGRGGMRGGFRGRGRGRGRGAFRGAGRFAPY